MTENLVCYFYARENLIFESQKRGKSRLKILSLMQPMHRVITHETRFARGTRIYTRQLRRAHCRSYVLLKASLVIELHVTSPYIVGETPR